MRTSLPAVAVAVALVLAVAAPEAHQPPGTPHAIEAFMRTARVVATRDTPKGVTRPLRLTLSDGAVTHDAVFQPIDEFKPLMKFPNGATEMNFVDSWRFNVAAYRLAGLLGLQEMMPVTIEYRYRNRNGSLAWWVASLMDEGERLKKKVQPPDSARWNEDMLRMRVFMELVQDTDRNLGNVLVSPDWRVIMLDFTRAFRLAPAIRAGELPRVDRAVLARLDGLTETAVAAATKDYLPPPQVAALLKRRDLIVAHFRARVQQLGEARVLY